MQVTVLYLDGCPNWRTAEQRIAEALRSVGRQDVAVARRRVATGAQAAELSFRGSPTILVDGRDPFADSAAPAGLACRLYRTGDGLAGVPTVEQLIEVLD